MRSGKILSLLGLTEHKESMMKQFETRPVVISKCREFGAKLDSRGRVILLATTVFMRPGKYFGTPYWCQVSKEYHPKEYAVLSKMLVSND